MGKGKDAKKNVKKAPAKTPKEKAILNFKATEEAKLLYKNRVNLIFRYYSGNGWYAKKEVGVVAKKDVADTLLYEIIIKPTDWGY